MFPLQRIEKHWRILKVRELEIIAYDVNDVLVSLLLTSNIFHTISSIFIVHF